MIDIYMKNTKKRAPSDRHSSRYYIFFSFSKVSFPEKLPPDGVQTCWTFLIPERMLVLGSRRMAIFPSH